MNLTLVNSARYPNYWSLQVNDPEADDNGRLVKTWRDPMFANGAMSAEWAVTWARDHGHTIVHIEAQLDRRPAGKDSTRDVICGIEYRSKLPVIEGLWVTPERERPFGWDAAR